MLACAATVSAQPVTTVITHGYSLDGTKGVWIEGMADAIIARAIAEGGATGGAVCRYDQATGAWQLVSGSLNADETICLIYRWLEDFAKPGPDWGFAEGAADALYAALLDPHFIDAGGAPLPGVELVDGRFMHFLGHSRGTIVTSEAVQRFGAAGITIDHVTGFDPHPMNGTLDWPVNYDWGDPTPVRWSNIFFHDNYWRADGGLFNAADPDGIPIAGAYNVELDEDALNCCAYSGAHSDVHLWYHGTIDLAPFPCDGEQCINQTMRNTWWPPGPPEGYTEEGFYYSVIGGGAALRPAAGLGGGTDPGNVPYVYNGTFDQISQAGWQFHGGFINAAIVNEGGRTFIKFGPAFGTSATHNRFFLPEHAANVTFSYRILAQDLTGLDDVLRAFVIDADGVATQLVGEIDLTQADAGWVAGASFAIPESVQRERTHRLQFVLAGGSGGLVHATAGVDDIDIEIVIPPPPTCAADMISSETFQPPGDGMIDAADLAFLLGEWGRNPGSLADIVTSATFAPPPDGVVDAADLAFLLGEWGLCP